MINIPDKRILKPLVEFLILVAFGATAVVEGIALERHWRPKGLYDRIGGGNFLLGIGLVLLLVACAFLFFELRRYRSLPDLSARPEEDKEKPQTKAMLITVLITALYLFLMPILGYLLPTIIFFVLNFTVIKFAKSQLANLILGVCLGIAFFMLFTHALGMFFPTGIWSLDFGVK